MYLSPGLCVEAAETEHSVSQKKDTEKCCSTREVEEIIVFVF